MHSLQQTAVASLSSRAYVKATGHYYRLCSVFGAFQCFLSIYAIHHVPTVPTLVLFPPLMTDHVYHTTPAGHKVRCTVEGSGSPGLIAFHGGGIVNGSRRDVYLPSEIKDAWTGTIIHADYRLLAPSTGFDIAADIEALFTFLLTLPIDHHNLFVSGYSGGGYPMRLAVMRATKESQSAQPRFTLRGWFSCFGMGGDLLLDYWLTPRASFARGGSSISSTEIEKQQGEWKTKLERFYKEKTEYSDTPYTEGLPGYLPARGDVWEAFHVCASISDVISGDFELSSKLAKVPYEDRRSLIPPDLADLFPQIYFHENAAHLSPGLLLHGDADEAVPYEESQRTLRDILDGGGRAELVTIHGADHNLSIGGEQTPEGHCGLEYAAKWMLNLSAKSGIK